MLEEQVSRRASSPGLLQELLVLFKVRIVVLLLLAAVGGAFLGARGLPGGGQMTLLLLTGAFAAMGSSALNEYLEREKDALMLRTRKRPLVTGAIARPRGVVAIAGAMIGVPVLGVLPFNPALSLFLALGAFTYVVVYTLWLKPRTTLNIVIGGAAGSFAVMSGGAAVNNWTANSVLLLAVLLFFWTPIHFWALALVYKEDYARAGVPMLPVKMPARGAAFWAFLHGIGTAASAVLLGMEAGVGAVYFVPVLPITAALLVLGIGLVLDPSKRRAWRLFHVSNLFLAVVLVAACVSSALLTV